MASKPVININSNKTVKAAASPLPKHKLKTPAKDVQSKADTFPNASILQSAQMKEMVALMEEDVAYQDQLKVINAERATIKDRLVALCRANKEIRSKGGVRWGTMAVYYGGEKSKRTLSKTLLIENGYLTAGQLEECYAEGKPYYEIRVKDLSKEDDKGPGSGED